MSYLVEQPPYCDLLRLSPTTRRFVRKHDGRFFVVVSGLCSLSLSLIDSSSPSFFLSLYLSILFPTHWLCVVNNTTRPPRRVSFFLNFYNTRRGFLPCLFWAALSPFSLQVIQHQEGEIPTWRLQRHCQPNCSSLHKMYTRRGFLPCLLWAAVSALSPPFLYYK